MTGASEVGPLRGVRVVEFAGLGPVPYAATLLADMGAQIIRVERLGRSVARSPSMLDRGRTMVEIDLKSAEGVRCARALCAAADVVLEGFRPGVAERLGVGPDELGVGTNPLVYGRATGWGRTGADAHRAGHDLTYLARSGVLSMLGPADGPPSVPLQLLADFAGGGAMLALGVCAALAGRGASGVGRVVDVAMVDGVTHLAGVYHAMDAMGLWRAQREANVFDGGAPFYGVYVTSDNAFLAVAAWEPEFYAELLSRLGLAGELSVSHQHDHTKWAHDKAAIAAVFADRPLSFWVDEFAGSDACVEPVVSLSDARVWLTRHGAIVDSPTEPVVPWPASPVASWAAGEPSAADRGATRRVLLDSGVADDTIAEWIARGVVGP